MRLIPNWREILTRAWSPRFMLLAMICTAIEVALPLFTADGLGLRPGTFAVLSGLASAAAFATRLLAQKGLTNANDP